MIEKLIEKIINKAKVENDHDYIISRAKVREDLRKSEDFTEEIDKALDKAGEFLLKLLDYPETTKIFFEEKFEKKSFDDYEKLFKEELEKRNKRK